MGDSPRSASAFRGIFHFLQRRHPPAPAPYGNTGVLGWPEWKHSNMSVALGVSEDEKRKGLWGVGSHLWTCRPPFSELMSAPQCKSPVTGVLSLGLITFSRELSSGLLSGGGNLGVHRLCHFPSIQAWFPR